MGQVRASNNQGTEEGEVDRVVLVVRLLIAPTSQPTPTHTDVWCPRVISCGRCAMLCCAVCYDAERE